MKYLEDFATALMEQYKLNFQESVLTDDETFHRDSERYQTLMDIINLDHEDIEAFYKEDEHEASMGQIDGSTRRH